MGNGHFIKISLKEVAFSFKYLGRKLSKYEIKLLIFQKSSFSNIYQGQITHH
jgi:hypothetical protein